MENFEKIIAGFLLFAITSVVAYLFRMRQLYVAMPKLYRHASISKDGSLCELIIFNKGHQVEENIQVEIAPELKAELLASSSTDISFEGSTMKIERLHKGCEASVIFLVENGLLDPTKISSVTSKSTKGVVCKKVAEVPPNYAILFLSFVFAIGILPGMFYGEKLYGKLRSAYVEFRLSAIHEQGWKSLSKYYGSDLRESYSNQEFPVRFIEKRTDPKKGREAYFEAYNKTAVPLTVYADIDSDKKREPGAVSPSFSSVELQPMSKQPLVVRMPDLKGDSTPAEIEFSFKSGNEFLHHLVFELDIKQ